MEKYSMSFTKYPVPMAEVGHCSPVRVGMGGGYLLSLEHSGIRASIGPLPCCMIGRWFPGVEVCAMRWEN